MHQHYARRYHDLSAGRSGALFRLKILKKKMNKNEIINEPLKNKRNMFGIAGKAIAFAWKTNRRLFSILVILYIFQGAIVYLQFTSFASIVDEIIRIQRGTGSMSK